APPGRPLCRRRRGARESASDLAPDAGRELARPPPRRMGTAAPEWTARARRTLDASARAGEADPAALLSDHPGRPTRTCPPKPGGAGLASGADRRAARNGPRAARGHDPDAAELLSDRESGSADAPHGIGFRLSGVRARRKNPFSETHDRSGEVRDLSLRG